jgi:ERCC4-related helicase
MQLTPYHAKYLANELTQRFASRITKEGFSDADNLNKITASLSDAQVDLNPHQVDAALFALRSPLSNGVILADEVGLGKTIEAGIVISQRWAERRKRILIICPANLRKQWSQELADKFFIPSSILEKKSFDAVIMTGNLNPFEQNDQVLLCSFQFARAKKPYLERTEWDLVVIDEAHRLRNVYKKDNKIGNAIKDALSGRPKILLTATPLQNNLAELFGLVSLVDEYIFGDIRSFRQQYAQLNTQEQFDDLKLRIAHVCKRTLRSQVREYVNYTDRVCITQNFESADDEHELYEAVSDYLRKPKLYALPASQRTLMILIVRKLLASSTFAIADTLKGFANRLEAIIERHERLDEEAPEITQDYDAYQETQDEWDDDPDFDGEEDQKTEKFYSPKEIEEIKEELAEMQGFYKLAHRIQRNSKGDNLVTALDKGFARMRELGGAEKAVIFTESVRTQGYIKEILEECGFKGKIVLFNGSNNDKDSTALYQAWLEKNKNSDRISGTRAADIRAALVDTFREDAQILIATEAAAEGINLQFCSIVVNYDMPWNPQRIEQRIGRCHRYGQKFNVVVINFLNERNAADVRVYNLLEQKFKLFDGVFGSSDEVLGTIETGVDFEKRIVQIYQNCRTKAEIEAAFDALRTEMETSITERLDTTHQQLMENFDLDVLKKIKMESTERLDVFENRFWDFSKFALAEHADQFNDENHSFRLTKAPNTTFLIGNYRFLSHRLPHDRLPKDAQVYRIGHPLAKYYVEFYKHLSLPCASISFDLTNATVKVSMLEELKGESGWLQLKKLTYTSIEDDEYLLFAGMQDGGILLSSEQCERLLQIGGTMLIENIADPAIEIQTALSLEIAEQIGTIEAKRQVNSIDLFDIESDKLDKWANDKRVAIQAEIKAVELDIRLNRNNLRRLATLAERVQAQRTIKDLEKKQADLRLAQYAAEDEIEQKREAMLDETQKKLEVRLEQEVLFTIRWEVS